MKTDSDEWADHGWYQVFREGLRRGCMPGQVRPLTVVVEWDWPPHYRYFETDRFPLFRDACGRSCRPEDAVTAHIRPEAMRALREAVDEHEMRFGDL